MTLDTVRRIIVYDKRNSVASTGRALRTVSLCTVEKYLLAMTKHIAIKIR